MYKLNSKSKLIRFYNWLWNTDATKYKTMCPFAWGYLCTIIILPFILLVKLVYFLLPAKTAAEYISETKVGKYTVNIVDKITSMDILWYNVSKIFKWILIGIFGISILLFLVIIIHSVYLYPLQGFCIIGIISIIFLLSFGIGYLFNESNIWYYIKKPFIFAWDMIYSLYKNMCPLIVWSNDNDKETNN